VCVAQFSLKGSAWSSSREQPPLVLSFFLSDVNSILSWPAKERLFMTGMIQPDLGTKYKEDIDDVSIAIVLSSLVPFHLFHILRYRFHVMFPTSISFRLSFLISFFFHMEGAQMRHCLPAHSSCSLWRVLMPMLPIFLRRIRSIWQCVNQAKANPDWIPSH
jgi:hypothetical protein